ncbi:Non-histone chromosomal protein HMG-14 [Lemmus lemmus]
MPKRRVSMEGAGHSNKPAPANVVAKPKKSMEKNKSSDKNVHAKGKRGAKGKQAEVADHQTTCCNMAPWPHWETCLVVSWFAHLSVSPDGLLKPLGELQHP